MSTGTGWSVIAALFVVAGGVVYLLLRAERECERHDRDAPTQILWTAELTHEVPGYPVTVAAAHRIMQQHRACDRDDCPRKRVAYQVLVEARHIKPDSGRIR
ncbi:hypothetical protein BJY24_007290 [Nocardia transvalensis]|uniref:Uncharacterized protein n=1 Tax=Nocardia transvalensis TaxID=37333 RepID=A0A7W9UM99_9NOCA|nr:hypothetical protein [Nocardia transvalensis]MBB5918378.1 hypothetical protein [Nocardia transvalensis]